MKSGNADSTDRVVEWLLAGDVAIEFQTRRDLLGEDRPDLQARIATEGWGARYIAARHADGTWGRGFYAPKWTCTHYTLLDLKNLGVTPDHPLLRESVHLIARSEKRRDGGVGPARSTPASDVCVAGMFLNYASWFGAPQSDLESVVDFLAIEHMPDGGFNCFSNTSGARHSSLHSTLSVLEGFEQYCASGYRYRLGDLEELTAAAREFILIHHLFRSDHTGAVIKPEFLRTPFPPRWKYNILRALDYFAAAHCPWDPRMADALGEIISRRRADGLWRLNAGMAGQVHFEMEKPGRPSRWITLMALRVLRAYGAKAGPRIPLA